MEHLEFKFTVFISDNSPRKTFSNRELNVINNRAVKRVINGSLKQKVPLLSMPLTDEDIVLDSLEAKYPRVKINRNSRRPKSPLLPKKSFESDMMPVIPQSPSLE